MNIVEGGCYLVGLGFAEWFKRVRAWLAPLLEPQQGLN